MSTKRNSNGTPSLRRLSFNRNVNKPSRALNLIPSRIHQIDFPGTEKRTSPTVRAGRTTLTQLLPRYLYMIAIGRIPAAIPNRNTDIYFPFFNLPAQIGANGNRTIKPDRRGFRFADNPPPRANKDGRCGVFLPIQLV